MCHLPSSCWGIRGCIAIGSACGTGRHMQDAARPSPRHCRGTSKRQMHNKACTASVKMLCTVVYALIHTSLVVVVWCCVIFTLCVDECVMFPLHVSLVAVVWCCVIFTLCIDACVVFTLCTFTTCLNTLCIDVCVMFTLCTFATRFNAQVNEILRTIGVSSCYVASVIDRGVMSLTGSGGLT